MRNQSPDLVLGWTTDLIRVAWGLFYWNTRKSIYRARIGKMVCPCQNRSDSGIAGKIGCEPALLFEKPIRFRRVCPLLLPDPHGLLKCSVSAAEVRPFWGRFWGFYLGMVLAVYLISTGITFGVMRQIGYPVSFSTVVWPPSWPKINTARAQYFLTQAEAAYAEGDGSTAIMSLALAYEYDPDNYDTGRLLAHLWSASRPGMSDRIYAQLMAKHPEEKVTTAQAWLRSLLSRAAYDSLEKLASSALIFDPDSTPAWIHALLFANRRTQHDEMIDQLLDRSEQLPAGVVKVLQLENTVRQTAVGDAKEALSLVEDENEPLYVLHYRVRRLIEIGESNRALVVLNQWESRFQDRDRIRLQLAAYADGRFRSQYHSLFRKLMVLAPSLPQIELVCAHLIVNPDHELYSWVKQSIRPAEIRPENEKLAAMIALYLLAASHRDTAEQQHLGAELRKMTGSNLPSLAIATAMAESPERYRIENILPSLQPLSLDMVYAMLERFEIPPE